MLKNIWWSSGLDIFSDCAMLCVEFKAAEADNEPLRYEQLLAPSSAEWTQICFLWVWRKEIRMFFSERFLLTGLSRRPIEWENESNKDYSDRIWKLSEHI